MFFDSRGLKLIHLCRFNQQQMTGAANLLVLEFAAQHASLHNQKMIAGTGMTCYRDKKDEGCKNFSHYHTTTWLNLWQHSTRRGLLLQS
jgi:hypothetical protein